MTESEVERVRRLMRLWGVVAVVAMAVIILVPHPRTLADPFGVVVLLQLCVMAAAIALAISAPMVWRMWKCDKRRQVWVFAGDLNQKPTGYFNLNLRGFSVGVPWRIEALAPCGILVREGDTVPFLGFLAAIPESIAIDAVEAGDTDFVGERPMSRSERNELARNLLGMLLNMAIRPIGCVVFAGMSLYLLDRVPPSWVAGCLLGIKSAVVLWAVFWLHDLWRILLMAADLARGKCRRREGWDLVTLPWSRTPWSKGDRPAEWRRGRRPILDVPPRARVTRI